MGEQSKQAVSYKQRIKQLTSKLHRLEDTLNSATEEWEAIRQQMLTQFECELAAYKKQCKALKGKKRESAKELETLRHYARKMMAQRTEIEDFFHSALAQVKKRAQRRLQCKFDEQMSEYSDSLNKLGLNVDSIQDQRIARDEIGIRAPNKLKSNPDASSGLDVVVKLDDLTLAEKEHVLKILITKINRSADDMQGALSKNQLNIVKLQPKSDSRDDDEELEKEDYNDTFLTQKKVEEQT